MSSFLNRKGVFRKIHFANVRSILDVGCGEASDLLYIVNSYKMLDLAVGLDICRHQNWGNIAEHHTCMNFVIASAHHLPFKSGVFDLVFLKDVLHHISRNRLSVIREAYSVVGQSGMLRVIEANRYHINPILVFKNDNSHDHFTFDQINILKRQLAFDELYGFELLPSSSTFRKDIVWNCYVIFLWSLTTLSVGRLFLFLLLKIKEKLVPNNLTYYVLSKKK